MPVRRSWRLLVLAGATALALGGAAACSLDFDRYAAVADATSGHPGADGSPESDSSADVGPSEDADAGSGGDVGVDAREASTADCGAVVPGCASQAGACATACGATSQQCQSQCHNNQCKTHCQQTEQSCRQGCESTCTNCIDNMGCSGTSGCADAAFAD